MYRLTRDEMAEWLGISPRMLHNLAADANIPAPEARMYDAKATVQAYCSYLRRQRSAPGHVSDERARLLAAQADGHELKNAATRGELVDARQVEAEWSNTLRSLRAAMIAVPSRVRQRLPGLSPAEVATIDAEIRSALTEAANDV